MIILRQREFSKSGEIWSGTKGALKSGMKGALIGGGIGAIGSLGAISNGKYRKAGIISGLGASIGAGIGAKYGWNKGIDEYKYNNDPEYREKIYENRKKELSKDAETYKKEALDYSGKLNPKDWCTQYTIFFEENGIEVPKDFLSYVHYFKKFATPRNIGLFFDDIIKNPGNYINKEDPKVYVTVYPFIDIFPFPIFPEYLENMADYLFDEIQLTMHNDPDVTISWNYDSEEYSIIGDKKSYHSFKEVIKSWVNYHIDSKDLLGSQLQVAKNFLNGM